MNRADDTELQMGRGFGWMPAYLVADELRDGSLQELPYAGGSRYRFTPRLVHRSDRPLGRAGRRLVELLRQSVWLPPPAVRRRRKTAQGRDRSSAR